MIREKASADYPNLNTKVLVSLLMLYKEIAYQVYLDRVKEAMSFGLDEEDACWHAIKEYLNKK